MTCGKGTEHRTRKCGPDPNYNSYGEYCEPTCYGDDTEEQECNAGCCERKSNIRQSFMK